MKSVYKLYFMITLYISATYMYYFRIKKLTEMADRYLLRNARLFLWENSQLRKITAETVFNIMSFDTVLFLRKCYGSTPSRVGVTGVTTRTTQSKVILPWPSWFCKLPNNVKLPSWTYLGEGDQRRLIFQCFPRLGSRETPTGFWRKQNPVTISLWTGNVVYNVYWLYPISLKCIDCFSYST